MSKTKIEELKEISNNNTLSHLAELRKLFDDCPEAIQRIDDWEAQIISEILSPVTTHSAE